MTTELTTIQDRARERVRTVFSEIFTDTELDEMLRSEIDAFFTKPAEKLKLTSRDKVSSNYSHNTGQGLQYEFTEVTLSPFQLIVWEFCSNHVREYLETKMEQPDLQTGTGYEMVGNSNIGVTTFQLSEELEKRTLKMAQQNMHLMFQQMFAGMMYQNKEEMIQEFANRFNTTPNY